MKNFYLLLLIGLFATTVYVKKKNESVLTRQDYKSGVLSV